MEKTRSPRSERKERIKNWNLKNLNKKNTSQEIVSSPDIIRKSSLKGARRSWRVGRGRIWERKKVIKLETSGWKEVAGFGKKLAKLTKCWRRCSHSRDRLSWVLQCCRLKHRELLVSGRWLHLGGIIITVAVLHHSTSRSNYVSSRHTADNFPYDHRLHHWALLSTAQLHARSFLL